MGYWPINYFLFAYESTNPEKLVKQIEALHNKHDLPLHSRIDNICILNKGVVCNWNKENKIISLPEVESKLGFVETDTALLLFYTLIMQFLNQAQLPNFNFTNYIENIDLGD